MSSLEDPLEEYTGLSLFSRTLGSIPELPHPCNTDNPLLLHDFLKSLPVKNPDKLVTVAKNILDRSKSEVSNSEKMASDEMLAHQKEVSVEKVMESPRVRRSGLGRKRPRFSLVPNSSQPSQDLYPTLDIDKLKDPHEFFKAFERLRMAKKEIDKQTGRVSQEQHQFSSSLAPRPRRPGIPGRLKKVKYRHMYPIALSQEAILNQGSQQETACGDIASQDSEMENFVPSQGEHGNLELEEAAGNDPVLKAETRYDKLLDELLARDREELDGDGALNLIKDHLQITSLDIEKLNLPELLNPHLKASGGIMQNTIRPLSDIQNMFKVTTSETPLKEKTANNFIHTLGSPTPPKSPFASLFLLKKRILQSNPRSDPFSAVGIDELPAQLASFSESRSLSSNLVNADKDLSSSRNFKTQQIEGDDVANGDMSFSGIATGSVAHSYDKSVNDDLTALGSQNDDTFDDLSGVLEGNSIDMDSNIQDENINGSDADVNVPINKPNGVENAVEDEMQQEDVVSVHPGANIIGFSTITSSDIQNQFEKSSPVPDRAMDECNETQDSDSGKCQDAPSEFPNENINDSASVSMTKRIKGQTHQCYQRERRAISRRQSLAASGTSWESGVRRSTRMRSRPLEYWKGERFLYGRIHESLATVIGIKYESPGGAAGKPTLKVMSFVSEEYKDLVELAALH